MWHLIGAVWLAAGALATFSSSGYVNNVFEVLKLRLIENGPVNWAVAGSEIELQRSDDNLSISFFRAYFQGLEHVELIDECSMRNLTTVIGIECLARFPHAIFTAYGNLREGASAGVIRVHVTTTNLLFLLRIEQTDTEKIFSFEPASPPVFDVTITPNLIPVGWDGAAKVEISKWSHGKFLNFLNTDIKWILNDIIAVTPIGNGW